MMRSLVLGGIVVAVAVLCLAPGPSAPTGSAPVAPNGSAHLGIAAVDSLGLGNLPTFPASANWPTYDHGVGRLGANPNETILGPVNAADLHLEWASNTTGPIESSLAIANGVVYTGAWDARGIYAFDAGTGALLWNVSAGGGWRPGSPAIAGHGVCMQGFSADLRTAWTGITSTPAISNGVLYIGGGNNSLFAFALDPASPANPPKFLWSTDLANYSSGSWQEHYLWGSPLVYRGNVYIGESSACEGPVDGQLFQVNTTSGKVAHVFTAVPAHTWGATIWSTPALDRAANTIYVTTGNEYEDNSANGTCANSPNPPNARAIVALNASDITQEIGHLQVASVCTDDDFGAGVTLFHASNGTAMLIAANKNGEAYALYRSSFHDNLSIPGAAWTTQTFQYDKSPGAFGGGLLYLGGYGSISGLYPESGTPAWTTSTTSYADGFVEAGVTYANGLVVAGVDWSNFTGSTLLVLNASSGALLYSYPVPGMMINGEPIVSDGRIFVGVGPTNLSGTGQLLSFGLGNLSASPSFGGVASRTTVGPDELSLDVIVLPNLSGGMPGYTCRVDWGDGATSSDCSFDSHAYDIPTFSAGPHYLNGSVAALDFAGSTSAYRFTLVANPNGSVDWSATRAHLATFEETGLPAGTPWSVTMNGGTGTSTTPEIAFVLANGSYNYSVHPISGYFVDPTGALTLATHDAILVIRFTPPPSVTLSPTSGPVGSSVAVTGSWFALSSQVNLTWGQIPIACASGSAITSANGAFTCKIAVPTDVQGGHNVIATGPDSGTASAVFTIHSSLRTSTTRADENQTVTVVGTGFSASSSWSVGWSGTLSIPCVGLSPLTSGGGVLRCAFVVPVGASGAYTLRASDSAYPKPNVASTTITITQDPTISTPVANRSSVDVGQPIRFSAVATLGSGGYTFRWTGLPSGCASTESSFACTPNGAGTFAIEATAKDSNGYSVGSNPLNFTVYPDPTTSAPIATPASIDIGQSVWISTTASYGSGAYAYAWSGLPPGCTGAGAAFGCTPLATGTFVVAVVATDGNGFPVGSDSLTLSISPDPTASPLVASSPSIDVGQVVAFSTSARLGSGDYAFDWSGLPSGCGDSAPTVTCADFPSAGSYRISVRITDSNGFAIDSATLGFTVYEDPVVTTPVANAPSADVGQSVTLSAGATGGSGGFSYLWTGLPAACSAPTPAVTCRASVPSDWLVTVRATDSNGYAVVSAPVSLSVFSTPLASAPNPSTTSLDVGQKVTLTSQLLDAGSGTTSAQWIPSDPTVACPSSVGLSVACTPSSPGSFSVTLLLTDSNGGSARSQTRAVTVLPDPLPGSPSLSSSVTDVGRAIDASITATRGSGGYAFSWQGLPGGCPATGVAWNCAPDAPGAYTVSVLVTDSNGFTVTSPSVLLAVNPAPSLLASPSSTTPRVGEGVQWSAIVTGGTGPFVVSWNFGDGTGDFGVATSHPYGKPGTYEVRVTVQDGLGVSSSESLRVTVSPAPVPAPSWFGLAPPIFGLLLAQFGAVVAFAFLAWQARRTRDPHPILRSRTGPRNPPASARNTPPARPRRSA